MRDLFSKKYPSKSIGHSTHYVSRRRFIASAGVLTAAAWLSPRQLFADEENIVVTARKRAETATISVQAYAEM